jgi:hypothetical protein
MAKRTRPVEPEVPDEGSIAETKALFAELLVYGKKTIMALVTDHTPAKGGERGGPVPQCLPGSEGVVRLNGGGFGALLAFNSHLSGGHEHLLIGPLPSADAAARVYDDHYERFNTPQTNKKRRKNFAAAGTRSPHLTTVHAVGEQPAHQRSPAVQHGEGRALQQAELHIADAHFQLDGIDQYRRHVSVHERERRRHQHHQHEGLRHRGARPRRLRSATKHRRGGRGRGAAFH